jgi:hypothetical protein
MRRGLMYCVRLEHPMRQEGEFHASAESLRSACARAHAGAVAAFAPVSDIGSSIKGGNHTNFGSRRCVRIGCELEAFPAGSAARLDNVYIYVLLRYVYPYIYGLPSEPKQAVSRFIHLTTVSTEILQSSSR